MKKYALIGHPLGHSMSPFIHKRLFEEAGRQAEYTLEDIPPESLKEKLPELLKSVTGLNVTIPHKVPVIDYVDKLDESALRYNSVNCICGKDGVLTGYNTDCDGFLRSVPENALGGKVLLLGCGGVGRMMAIEAARHGADITMAIIPEAQDMADCLKREIVEKYPRISVKIVMMNEISGKFDLLVNATPVGMYPKSDACPVSEEVIGNCGAVFDAIYNPTKTKLVTIQRSKGYASRPTLSVKRIGELIHFIKERKPDVLCMVDNCYGEFDSYTKEQIDKIINESVEIVNRDFK